MPDLQRFIAAQDPVIERVAAELAAGAKRTHWMWFIFPQLAGLGHSPTAQHYALASLEQARAYLEHPVLGPRLRECTGLVLQHAGRSVHQIFGYPDDLKFHSCMTLFAQLEPQDPVFARALAVFFAGKPDARTLELLAG